MQTVHIFSMSSAKGTKKQDANAIYVLAVNTSKGEQTRTSMEELKCVTKNQSEIEILIKAVKRLLRPCKVVIHTESSYVAAVIEQGWLKKWKMNNWKNAKEREVANIKEWKVLDELMEKHEVTVIAKKEHSYRSWMKNELRKETKENV